MYQSLLKNNKSTHSITLKQVSFTHMTAYPNNKATHPRVLDQNPSVLSQCKHSKWRNKDKCL